ncbi:hypothetical protein PSENEW3n2_00002162 [Picochlorum sp. SENEW3]|nr:hypothetical protein PSENEW3n2_00002162 [Picochlorum sp. SENEW3]WPT14932.1 hypothetical protein PSENEW3_00002162 [Picochlorum sp. SENEW3]
MGSPELVTLLGCLGARESVNAWLAEEGEVGVVKTKVFHIPTRALVILLSAVHKLGILTSLIIALANILVLVLGHDIAHSVVHGDCILATGAVDPATSHGFSFADILVRSCPLALLLLHLISSPLSSGSKLEWPVINSLHASECEQHDGDNECTVAEHGMDMFFVQFSKKMYSFVYFLFGFMIAIRWIRPRYCARIAVATACPDPRKVDSAADIDPGCDCFLGSPTHNSYTVMERTARQGVVWGEHAVSQHVYYYVMNMTSEYVAYCSIHSDIGIPKATLL